MPHISQLPLLAPSGILIRKDRRIYNFSCCCLCGTGWGAVAGAANQGEICAPNICLACGSTVCQSHGLDRGNCPICLVGRLGPGVTKTGGGWSGWDRGVCHYKGCRAKPVADDGRWPVCSVHLEQRRPGYIANLLASMPRGWLNVRGVNSEILFEEIEQCPASS